MVAGHGGPWPEMRVRLPPKALVCDAGKRPSLQNSPRGPSLRNLKVPCFSLLCENRRFESSGGSEDGAHRVLTVGAGGQRGPFGALGGSTPPRPAILKWVRIWNGNLAREGRCGSLRHSPGTARRAWLSGISGEVPDFDLLTWSSPCQDFSNAGLGKGGEEGQRDSVVAALGSPERYRGEAPEVHPVREREGLRVGEERW